MALSVRHSRGKRSGSIVSLFLYFHLFLLHSFTSND
jgi:hypothetical protein